APQLLLGSGTVRAEVYLLNCRNERTSVTWCNPDDEYCLPFLARDREFSVAPLRFKPGGAQHDEQRLTAPQLLVKTLFPIDSGGYAVGGIEIEEKTFVALFCQPILELLRLSIVAASMADEDCGHPRRLALEAAPCARMAVCSELHGQFVACRLEVWRAVAT